jgi:glyoxylase-like metal-dependent hydrolase (beta-lactamase superfamily II)
MLRRDREALPLIRFAREPELVRSGDRVDGWEVVELPGHADGHLGFFRDGVLLVGDHLLPDITPAVGVYPESRPDPLGAYVSSLEKTIELAPRLALPAHGEPIHDPAGRAREILDHHEERLDETREALAADPLTGYEISLSLFAGELGPSQRRFAVAETLAHLERLVVTGDAARHGDVERVTYTAP